MPNTMTFLSIGGTDVSSHIDIQEYKVNAEDVYDSWTDGNWVTHRVVTRTRVSGTCEVGFASATDYAAFVALLATARQPGGWYNINCYLHNKGANASVQAYIDTDGEAKWDLTNSRQWQTIVLTITER